jgi:hypothetical protein
MMRRRRPAGRLVRTVGRTAVIAGTATAVGGAVAGHQQKKAIERQQEAFDQQQAAVADQQVEYVDAPEAPAEMTMDKKLEALEKLATLRDQGVLTEVEFETQKAKILNS